MQGLYEISRQAVHAVLKACSCGPCAHVCRKAVWKHCRRGVAPAKGWHCVRDAGVPAPWVHQTRVCLAHRQLQLCHVRPATLQYPRFLPPRPWPPPGACLLSVLVPAGASFLSPRLLIRHPGYHLTPAANPCLLLPHACPPTCCHIAPAATSSLPQCLLPPHPCLAPAAASFLSPICCGVPSVPMPAGVLFLLPPMPAAVSCLLPPHTCRK